MKTKKKAIPIKPEPVEFWHEKEGFGQYLRMYYFDKIKVYRFEELHTPRMEAVIRTARKMYIDECEKHLKKHGDEGSVILGNGIYIAVKPPRARSVFRMQLCHPRGQSDGPSYAAKDKVLSYLFENGVDAWYEHGHMD